MELSDDSISAREVAQAGMWATSHFHITMNKRCEYFLVEMHVVTSSKENIVQIEMPNR